MFLFLHSDESVTLRVQQLSLVLVLAEDGPLPAWGWLGQPHLLSWNQKSASIWMQSWIEIASISSAQGESCTSWQVLPLSKAILLLYIRLGH